MSRITRLYYYALLGAMGGLIGWQVSNVLGLQFLQNLYLNEAVVGGLIGFSVGALIGIWEGISLRSPGYALRSAFTTGGLGMIGGAVGLPLSEGLFQLLGGQPWARSVGWAIFGLLVGFGLGALSGAQRWKPALGGLIGGAVGGALLEIVRIRFSDPLTGKAVGLASGRCSASWSR